MNNIPSSRSPWATLKTVQTAHIAPIKQPVRHHFMIPGSKSLTNRALLLAAAAKGESTIKNFLKSDDAYWGFDALRKFGCHVDVHGYDARITPPLKKQNGGEVFLGSAGTLARFLPGMLCKIAEGQWIINASEQLCGRPMQPLFKGLQSLGADLAYIKKADHYPISLSATHLRGGVIELPGHISSQFISGLLMAAPLAKEAVTLHVTSEIVQKDYVQLTLDAMEAFGVSVKIKGDYAVMTTRPQKYQGCVYEIEGDASTASYFAALAAVTNGDVMLDNIGTDNTQPDLLFLDILERMGCVLERSAKTTRIRGSAKLKGGFEIDMKPMSDTALTLAAVAPFADAPITIRNVAHIRKHESDRIHVICEALQQMGVKVEEFEDGMTIHPAKPKDAVLETHDDHRVAMALSLTGLGGQGVSLKDPGCVSKTCPIYFDMLEEAGIGVSYE